MRYTNLLLLLPLPYT